MRTGACSTWARRRACATASASTGRPAAASSPPCASSRPSSASRTWSTPSPTPSQRPCLLRRTWSSATSRASTSASRTTSATPSSRSPWRDDFPHRAVRAASCPRMAPRYLGCTHRRGGVDEATNLIRRMFPFRTCTTESGWRPRTRQPCLLYRHQAVPGPCIEAISKRRLPSNIHAVVRVPGGQPGAGGAADCGSAWRGCRVIRLRRGGRAARQVACASNDDARDRSMVSSRRASSRT